MSPSGFDDLPPAPSRPSRPPSSFPSSRDNDGTVFDLTINLPRALSPSDTATIDRLVTFFVPHSIVGKREVPFMIAFHGGRENGHMFRTKTLGYGYDELAVKEGFVIAYPHGYQGSWNDSRVYANSGARNENIDDLSLTRALITLAEQRWQTPRSKVAVVGYSNGGSFVMRLVMELGSAWFGAAAIHCANVPMPGNLDEKAVEGDAVPVIIVNGLEDPISPYNGGFLQVHRPNNPDRYKDTVLTSDASIDSFAIRHLLRGSKILLETAADPFKITRQWKDGTGNVVAKLVGMRGEGHFVPLAQGEKKPLPIGPRKGDVHAPKEVMAFLKESTPMFNRPGSKL